MKKQTSGLTPPRVFQELLMHFLLFTVVFFSCYSYSSDLLAEIITPDKEITIVNKDSRDPLWKQWWDSARELTQQQNYPEAIKMYQAVLQKKPNIEEVKWELCKVFIEVKDYKSASLLLQSLLEIDNTRIDYLISAGNVALVNRGYDQAILFYGQALELDPGGAYADFALHGLISSLKSQGKNEIAIPLLEQLYQRGASTPDLLLDLARFTKDAGNLQKARYYYSELVKKYRVDAGIVRETADVLEQIGKDDEAAIQWERYLQDKPDDLVIRQKLAEYLLAIKEPAKALPHLQVLIDNGIDREQYILTAGSIYLINFGRADKALSYFEQYRSEFPDGKDVSSEIANLQLILANDLLSIVENDGVWNLWDDLADVTPDRISIYRTMAELLGEFGKEKEIIKVLQVIVLHAPEDLKTRMQLSQLYLKNQLYEECTSTLAPAENMKNLPASYYLLRAQCQKGMKNHVGLLRSYETYLDLRPSDSAVRKEALNLAGGTGLIELMDKLFSDSSPESRTRLKNHYDVFTIYLAKLIQNQLYSKALNEIERVFGLYTSHGDILLALSEIKADIYLRQGNAFASEQLLRENLALFPASVKTLSALAEFALKRKNSDSASIWLSTANQTTFSESNESADTLMKSKLFYLNLRRLSLSGAIEDAMIKAREYLAVQESTKAINRFDADILLFMLKECYDSHQYDQCQLLLKRYQAHFLKSAEVIAMAAIINDQLIKTKQKTPPGKQGKSIPERLDMCDLFLEMNDYPKAQKLLETILSEQPDSLRARVLLAQLHFESFDYSRSYDEYYDLGLAFPEETFFKNQIQELEYLLGNSSKIIEDLVHNTNKNMNTSDIVSKIKNVKRPALRLFLARVLWTENRWDESLQIYSDLYGELTEKVDQGLSAIKKTLTAVKQPVLSGPTISSSSENQYLDIIMDPSFFAAHRENEIAALSASFYEPYRWQRIVAKERQAKNALNARKFYQAEKNYQELLVVAEETKEEAYPDLATIYGRLGRHTKEAELLEKIKEKKIGYPGLKEATEKNTRQRQPQLSLEGTYREEDGRNGYINISQNYSGLGLRIQPTAFQETGFRAGRNEYGNSQASTLAKSNYIIGHYGITFNDFVDVAVKLGFEDFDTDISSIILYDVTVTGNFDERVKIYASLNQKAVDDTIQSLFEGIYRSDFVAGITIDAFPGIFMGVDFSLQNYNDDNTGQSLDFWTSYRVFGDASSMNITYNYEKLQNDIENSSLPFEYMVDGEEGLSYWSPGNYWKHMLTAEFRRELWQTGKLQSGTSFLSGMYGLGYESETNFVQMVKLQISLEIHRQILIKGSFVSEWSDDYDRKDAYASLIYRW